MAIKIKISDPQDKTDLDQEVESIDTSMEMVLRKTLDGNYMIKDHIDVNIMVHPSQSKIIVTPKDKNPNSDIVYATQNRLFHFLKDKGVVDPDSVQGGDAYFSMEATFPESAQDTNPVQAVIFSIGKFIEEEEPYMKFDEKLEDQFNDWFTDPDDEHSTELGEVPQDADKGSISMGTMPYGQYYTLYEQVIRDRYGNDE